MWPRAGPAPAAGGAAGLLVDLAVRLLDLAVGQRLLQFGDTGIGDLGAVKVERLQVGHLLDMHLQWPSYLDFESPLAFTYAVSDHIA